MFLQFTPASNFRAAVLRRASRRCGLVLHARHHVGLGGEGDPGGGVSETLGYDLAVDGLTQEQGRVGVSEFVEADRETESADGLVPLSRESVRVPRAAVLLAEHEPVVAVCRPLRKTPLRLLQLVVASRSRQRTHEGDGTPAPGRLRTLEGQCPVAPLQVLPDCELAGLEIDVLPAQAEQSAAPQPRTDSESGGNLDGADVHQTATPTRELLRALGGEECRYPLQLKGRGGGGRPARENQRGWLGLTSVVRGPPQVPPPLNIYTSSRPRPWLQGFTPMQPV